MEFNLSVDSGIDAKGGIAIMTDQDDFLQADGNFGGVPYCLSISAWDGYNVPEGCRFVEVSVQYRVTVSEIEDELPSA